MTTTVTRRIKQPPVKLPTIDVLPQSPGMSLWLFSLESPVGNLQEGDLDVCLYVALQMSAGFLHTVFFSIC